MRRNYTNSLSSGFRDPQFKLINQPRTSKFQLTAESNQGALINVKMKDENLTLRNTMCLIRESIFQFN